MDQLVSQLEQVLQQVLRPTEAGSIKAASEQLKREFYPQPATVPALIQILQSNQDAQLRQLAGVEVRKLVASTWAQDGALDEQTKAQIRSRLLQTTLEEQNSLVRHTSARVISAIASVDVDEQKWPELLPQLVEIARAPQASSREVAVYVLFTLLEADYSELLLTHAADLTQLLSNTVKDPESLEVRVTSVQALCKVADLLDAQGKSASFQPLVGPVVEVLEQTIEAGDDKSALLIFECLQELLLGDAALLGNAFGELYRLMLEKYACSAEVDDEFRVASLQFIYNSVRFRSKKVQSLKFGPHTLHACLQILSAADLDDEDDDDDTTPQTLALRVLDLLAAQLPPSQVMAPLMEALPQMLQSGKPAAARAAYLSISMTVEGAPEFVANELETLLEYVVHGLNSSDQHVSVAALQALSMLAVELRDAVSAEHERLLPLVFGIMDNASSLKIGRFACMSLDAILETLDREIITEKYLDVLVPKLLTLVTSTSDTDLRANIVQAIGSCAFASGSNFRPFFEQTVQILSQFIIIPEKNTEPAVLHLCGNTVDCLGTICRSVGAEMFAPILENVMTAVLAYTDGETSELREAAFVFVGVAAKIYKESFLPYIERIMPSISKTFDQKEFSIEDDDNNDEIGVNDEEGDLMDSVKINGAVATEKEYAVDCIADVFSSLPSSNLAQYFEAVLEQLGDLSQHFFEDIRRSVVVALLRILTHVYLTETNKKPMEWAAGFPFADVASLTPLAQGVIAKIHTILVEMLAVEDEVMVMNSLFEYWSDSVRACGPVVLGNAESLQDIVAAIFEVFGKKHRSQVGDDELDDYSQEDEEETSESSETLISCASDFIVQIASALGPAFKAQFEHVAQCVAPYVTSKSASERSIGVGCFAELVEVMKADSSDFTDSLLKLFLQGLDDKKLVVRSMAAYGAGLICFYSTQAELIQQSYPVILPKLQGLLKRVDKEEKRRNKLENTDEEFYNDQRSLANACGCVSRMASRFPESIPIDQVLPVLLSRLPLQDAFEENIPILEFLRKLAMENWALLSANLQDVMRVVEQIYAEQDKADKRKGAVEGESAAISQLYLPEAAEMAKQLLLVLEHAQPGTVSQHPYLSTRL